MSATVNPEVAALREKVETHGREIAELRGGLQQLDKIVSATTRQSIWQLVALIISLCAAIIGGLVYQTTMIDKRIEQIDKRIEQIEKRIEQSERNTTARIEQLEKRIEQSEKNITARFEDLKQEVRAQRK